MRILMGLIKNAHGVYNARQKVPPKLQEAVATVLDQGKNKQTWLKKSLGTKDIREANIRAKPVLIEFDRIIARTEALIAERPVRESLTPAEIRRMADYHFAQALANQDTFVSEAPAAEATLREEEGDEPSGAPIPVFGLSHGQMLDAHETMARVLPEAEKALVDCFPDPE